MGGVGGWGRVGQEARHEAQQEEEESLCRSTHRPGMVPVYSLVMTERAHAHTPLLITKHATLQTYIYRDSYVCHPVVTHTRTQTHTQTRVY